MFCLSKNLWFLSRWPPKSAVACVGIFFLFGCMTAENFIVRIPSLQNLSSLSGTGGHYVVQSGDTLYDIARKYRLSNRALIRANGLTAPYMLRVGQKITIPVKKGYRVQKGDTLFKIAQQFSVDPYDIARANGLVSPFRIYPQQNLIIPTVFIEADPLPTTNFAPVQVTQSRLPQKTQKHNVQHQNAQSKQSRQSAPSPSTAAPQQVASIAATSVGSARPPEASLWPRPVMRPERPNKIAESKNRPLAQSVPKSSGKGFAWPVRGRVVSTFGAKRAGLYNDGINIAAPKGTAVKAAENGIVVYSGNLLKGFGNMILLRHANGFVTAYAHNAQNLVKRGEMIKRGQVIARVGTSGNVEAPQLHFQIRKGKKTLNPQSQFTS